MTLTEKTPVAHLIAVIPTIAACWALTLIDVGSRGAGLVWALVGIIVGGVAINVALTVFAWALLAPLEKLYVNALAYNGQPADGRAENA